MTWIETVNYEDATGKLRRLLDQVKGPDGKVDNILLSHGLRPGSLQGHMALYKNVLHHSGNSLPKWLLEALGVYVSMMNRCTYCVEHHYTGMKRLLQDDQRAETIRLALEQGKPGQAFEGREAALMSYAETLTRTPDQVSETQIHQLRQAGLEDGQILEANQVIAYFAYANRTVLGLGVHLTGDTLGLSPNSSDEEDWSHS